MERDPFGQDRPLYHFVRTDQASGLSLNDGSHIVYVNGERRYGEDDLSRLMHDFFCTDPDDMYYEPLARVVRRFKRTEEGVRKMSSVVEEILAEGRIEGLEEGLTKGREEGRMEGRMEGAREANIATVRQLLRMGGFTLESMAEITGLRLEEVRAIAENPAR